MENNFENQNITLVDINKEMRHAYLQYSMSVIVGRALPDVRDGLKPVHRRVLFAQYEMSNTHDKAYKKSARVVGDVIGKYHPHGDTAVYDTMVRMAQDFSLRYPLEDGQGNFGSVDGDSPAAMRYTEIRMTRLAEELLVDIEKETVPFGPNYDESFQIPLVLPAKFPNLLVNGSAGIAVGMATNIPPHNLSEVIDATIHLIHNPECSIEDLIQKIPGPDFPTRGIISGLSGIHQAYRTGKGIISVRGKADVETLKDGREEIIISEIPYQVNKAKLIEHIADLVKDKQIEGVTDIRDESSREGMRIVVTVKRGEDSAIILNRLYKFTQMQVSFGIIMLALDKDNQPITFNLKSMLGAFIEHRREVVTQRCVFDLRKAQEREHILLGLKKALDHIDEIVALIRGASDAKDAHQKLVARFDFSEKQAQAILEMRLQRLTGLERSKIEEELAELLNTIEYLKKVLSDIKEIYRIIIEELTDIQARFGDVRRTRIEGSENDYDDEDLIADEDVVVTITKSGYIKRLSVDDYRTQKRGGRGRIGIETREEDYVTEVFLGTTKSSLLIITDKGRLYTTKIYKIPKGDHYNKGRSVANLIKLENNERVMAIVPLKEFTEDQNLVMITERGVIKKTALSAFSNARQNGIIALTTDLGDRVIDAKISDGNSHIFVVTREGMSIRFEEEDVRTMGRGARGVRAISLVESDAVVAMEILESGCTDHLLVVTNSGMGKRSETSEYRCQSRGGSGVLTLRTTEKSVNLVGVRKANDRSEIILSTDTGQMIRIPVNSISVVGRVTQGVRLIRLNANERVTSFTVVQKIDGEDIETV